jgi:hypothetical protein
VATTGSPATDPVLGDPHAEHLVQLYGSDPRALVRSVGRYLADGLNAGEGAVVIATAAHRGFFLDELRALGIDPAAALAAGRLLVLDADDTLARFMVDGQPDGERFEAAVRPVLASLRALCAPGVRAYGEMVGVLWEAGSFCAAIRLEELWNALLRDGGFRLFCGYPIDVCGDAFTPADVDAAHARGSGRSRARVRTGARDARRARHVRVGAAPPDGRGHAPVMGRVTARRGNDLVAARQRPGTDRRHPHPHAGVRAPRVAIRAAVAKKLTQDLESVL